MLVSVVLRPSDVATLIYRGKSEASAVLRPSGVTTLVYRGKPAAPGRSGGYVFGSAGRRTWLAAEIVGLVGVFSTPDHVICLLAR